jgi:hypothetical protein
MSVRVNDQVAVAAAVPFVGDLGDLWLAHALACLFHACQVSDADRIRLLEPRAEGEPPPALEPAAAEEIAPLERLDACRRAIVFAALAIESRLNRVLRGCGAVEQRVLAHVSPAEQFLLAPRLLGQPDSAAHAALGDAVADVFATRGELADAADGPLADARSRFSPTRACAVVEHGAAACRFLVTLTRDSDSGTAGVVVDAAAALAHRATELTVAELHRAADWDWDGLGDFPPNLIGS